LKETRLGADLGEQLKLFHYDPKDLHSITTPYAASDAMAKLLPAPSNKEATPSSYKEAPSDIAVQDAKEGAKGGKKRCKQRPEWVTTAANYDGGNDEKQAAPAWGASLLPHTAASTRHDHLQTTSRNSLRRPPQTTCTPSRTSLGTMT
jgi:hypothetical protein